MSLACPHLDLDDAIRRTGGHVPLAWVRSVDGRPANFGDAASAHVVAAMSGLAPLAQSFDDPVTRVTAVGTIGHDLRFGTIHLWGTGVDANRRSFGRTQAAFAAAPATTYVVHATRGPMTRQTLLDAGIFAPPIYGDGCQFLPRIYPSTGVTKRYELGVIPHISEFAELSLAAAPLFERYSVSEDDGVRLVSTFHDASVEGWKEKLHEILMCRRIVSMSFHGKLLADCYGIPNLYFPRDAGGFSNIDLADERIDHRFADYYLGAGLRSIDAYFQAPDDVSPWDQIIAAIDGNWKPFVHSRDQIFFESFPVTPKVSYLDKIWSPREELLENVPW